MFMNKVFVLGATGSIGAAIVFECVKQSIPVIAFARDEHRLNQLFGHIELVSICAGDVFDKESILKSSANVDVFIHAINFPYEKWQHTHIRALTNIIETAKARDAKLIMIDNIYAYSKGQANLTEKSRKEPSTQKGRLRLQMEQHIYLSGLEYMIIHAPDIYGPHALSSHVYVAIDALLKGKKAYYIGPLEAKREFIYTPDLAHIVLQLGKQRTCYMQNWNVPGGLKLSGLELQEILSAYAKEKVKLTPIKKPMLALLGIFQPFLREVLELYYLYAAPVHLDGTKLKHALNELTYTPADLSLEQTYEWIKNQQ